MLYNRKHFLGQLSQMIKKSMKTNCPFHVLAFDINRFSIVNNTEAVI